MEEIDLQLDFRSKKPLSDQIRDQVRDLIQHGILLPNSQLPTVRSLAAFLRINFNTVARAYRALDQEGLISTQLGRGTYVLDSETAEDEERPSAQAQADWLAQKIDRMFAEASRLGIPPDQLHQAFEQRLKAARASSSESTKKEEAKKKAPPNRVIKSSQKKRTHTALWDQNWPENDVRTNRSHKKIRKVRLKR